jgi:hypothetical protein
VARWVFQGSGDLPRCLKEMVAPRPPSGGSRPVPIGSRPIGVSLQPAIPRRVAPQQSPLPLHQSPTIVAQSRSSEAIKCAARLSLQRCSSGRARRARRQPGVSFLLCAPGDISTLRRHTRESLLKTRVFERVKVDGKIRKKNGLYVSHNSFLISASQNVYSRLSLKRANHAEEKSEKRSGRPRRANEAVTCIL